MFDKSGVNFRFNTIYYRLISLINVSSVSKCQNTRVFGRLLFPAPVVVRLFTL